MYFFFVKKDVILRLPHKSHQLLAPSDSDIAAKRIPSNRVYCGAAVWEIKMANDQIPGVAVISNDIERSVAHKKIKAFTVAGHFVDQILKIVPGLATDPQMRINIGLINGFGTMLGDSSIGLGALKIFLDIIKVKCPNIRVHPILAWNARPHAEKMFGGLDAVEIPKLSSVTFDEFNSYHAYWDFSSLLTMEGFDSSNLFDFYLNHLGLNSEEIQSSNKKPYVFQVEKIVEQELDKLLGNLSGKSLITLQPMASTPIRSMPEKIQRKIIEELIASTNNDVVLTHPMSLDTSWNGRVINLHDWSSKSIGNFIAIMRRVDLVITVDTLALHLANGLNKKTLAIFTTIAPDLRVKYASNCISMLIPEARDLAGWRRHKVDDAQWKNLQPSYLKAWSTLSIKKYLDAYLDNKLLEEPGSMIIRAMAIPKQAGVNEARIDEPLGACARIKNVDVSWQEGRLDIKDTQKSGVIIFHRQFLNTNKYIDIINRLASQGWLITLDIDDDPRHWPAYVDSNFFAFKCVHLVSVSTEKLARVVRQWNPNVVVLPNGFDSQKIVKKTQKRSGLKRIFFGALNRKKDWEPIIDQINQYLAGHPDVFHFTVVHDKEFYLALKTEHKQFYPVVNYQKYLEILSGCDFSLMPLLDTEFNQCKSDLKLLESLGCGVIPIASNIVYGQIDHVHDFSLICENAHQWYERLEEVSGEFDSNRYIDLGLTYLQSERSTEYLAHRRVNLYREAQAKIDMYESQRVGRLSLFRKSDIEKIQYIEALVSRQDYQKAYDTYLNTLQGSVNSRLKYLIAFSLVKLDQLDLAISVLHDIRYDNIDDLDSIFMLGVINARKENYEIAMAAFKAVISLNENHLDAKLNLIKCYIKSNQLAEAENILSIELIRHPTHGEMNGLLGLIQVKNKSYEKAVVLLKIALKESPDDLTYLNDLSIALCGIEKYDEAEEVVKKLLHLRPSSVQYINNLAEILFIKKQYKDANLLFKKSHELGYINEDLVKFVVCASEARDINFINQIERSLEATYGFKNSIELSKTYDAIGFAYHKLGIRSAAISAFESSLKCNSKNITSIVNLAIDDIDNKKFESALSRLQFAESFGSSARMYGAFGTLYGILGDTEKSISYMKRAVEVDPKNVDLFSNYLFRLSQSDLLNAEELYLEHKKINNFFNTKSIYKFDCKFKKDKIRIGFVSADFYQHAVSLFILPLIEKIDRNAFEIYLYSNNPKKDKVTEILIEQADAWRNIYADNDQKVASCIYDDSIDVLIDLSGHTFGNRLGVFAIKPAKHQISFVGYPNTTGLMEMDYLLADSHLVPELESGLYTEKILTLSSASMPPYYNQLPEIIESPCVKNGFITFGSFNRLGKINQTTLRFWKKILDKYQDSKLAIYGYDCELAKDILIKKLNTCLIDMSRVSLYPRSSFNEYLNNHNYVDICLDTFPYNGGTTTHFSLLMGVPVVSCVGLGMRSRSTFAILSAAGMTEWIVTSEDFLTPIDDFYRSAVAKVDIKKSIQNKAINIASSQKVIAVEFADLIKKIANSPCQHS